MTAREEKYATIKAFIQERLPEYKVTTKFIHPMH
jgi:hypothetical protein